MAAPAGIQPKITAYTTAKAAFEAAQAPHADGSIDRAAVTAAFAALKSAYEDLMADVSTADYSLSRGIRDITSEYHGPVSRAALGILAGPASVDGAERAFPVYEMPEGIAVVSETSQSNIKVPAERALGYSATSIYDYRSAAAPFDTIARTPSHSAIAEYQKHSCGANVLEAMLRASSQIEGEPELTGTEANLLGIIERGVVQYVTIRDNVAAVCSNGSDPRSALFRGSVGGDGVAVNLLNLYYQPKGLTAESEYANGININYDSQQDVYNSLFGPMKNGQSIVLNLFGRFIGVACKVDADGNKKYLAFDSHTLHDTSKAKGDDGTSIGAAMTSFTTLDNAVNFVKARFPHKDGITRSLQFQYFNYNKANHEAFVEKANERLAAIRALKEEDRSELLTRMRTGIAASEARVVEEEEASARLARRMGQGGSGVRGRGGAGGGRAGGGGASTLIRRKQASNEVELALINSLLGDYAEDTKTILESMLEDKDLKALLVKLNKGTLTAVEIAERDFLETLSKMRINIFHKNDRLFAKEMQYLFRRIARGCKFDLSALEGAEPPPPPPPPRDETSDFIEQVFKNSRAIFTEGGKSLADIIADITRVVESIEKLGLKVPGLLSPINYKKLLNAADAEVNGAMNIRDLQKALIKRNTKEGRELANLTFEVLDDMARLITSGQHTRSVRNYREALRIIVAQLEKNIKAGKKSG